MDISPQVDRWVERRSELQAEVDQAQAWINQTSAIVTGTTVGSVSTPSTVTDEQRRQAELMLPTAQQRLIRAREALTLHVSTAPAGSPPPPPPSGTTTAQQPTTPPAPAARRQRFPRIRRILHGIWTIIKVALVVIVFVMVLWAIRDRDSLWQHGLNGAKSVNDGIAWVVRDVANIRGWNWTWPWEQPGWKWIPEETKSTDTPDSEECIGDQYVCEHYGHGQMLAGCDVIVSREWDIYVVFKREGASEYSETILPAGEYRVANQNLDGTFTIFHATNETARSAIEKSDGYIEPTHSKVTALFVRVDSASPSMTPDLGAFPSSAP